jgi:imidazolonepropionase-like amidohydrolase
MTAINRLTALAALVVVSVALSPVHAHAQEADAYVIQGATIHTMSGQVIENGSILIREGRIVEVGPEVQAPAGAEVIDATGQHVYPGMIDAFSRLGLTEIGSVSATNDQTEMGNFNPHLNAYTAIHPASEHIPVARANGITHTLTAPGSGGGGFGGFGGGGGAGGIAGQATLLHLDGWTVEEMAIEQSAAMVMNWPTIQSRTFDFSTFSMVEGSYTEAKKVYDEAIAALEEWFVAAKHYRQAVASGSERVERDLQLENLARVLDEGLPVIVVADEKRSIESAVEFSERHGFRMILAGGRDAREVKGMLAEKDIPVILGPTQTTPSNDDDPYDAPNTLAGELYEAGVQIAFATFNSADSRTLPYEVANTVSFGLPREAAMEAITMNAAQILGVGDRLGSIEAGKIANIIVTDGDPLERRPGGSVQQAPGGLREVP